MSRLEPMDPALLSPEQKRVYDEIASARSGTVRGPFAVWLRIPRIADAANRFGNALRRDGELDKRLFELMVLLVARHWSAQYEWYAHERAALEAGIAPAVLEAIRARKVPDFSRADERLVYDVVTEINESKGLSDGSYARAVAQFGVELLIELITAAGFYTAVAMVIQAFDAPVPEGARPLP